MSVIDPFKNKVIRISYYSKLTKKPKHKQVRIDKFESEEHAKEYLEKWKQEQQQKENDEINNKTNNEEPTEPTEPTEPQNNIPLPNVIKTKFKLNTKTDNGCAETTILFGSGQSGKTTLTMHIVKKYFSDPKSIVIIMSPSINVPIYKEVRKMKNVIYTDFFDGDLIKDIAKIQRKTENKYRFVIVLDDVVDSKNSIQILKMITIYRNLNISTVMNLQDVKLMSRSGRHNGNNFIFLRQNTQDAALDCIELYLNSYPPIMDIKDKMQKVNMYRKLTDNRGFIYLNALDNDISFHDKINL